MQKTHQHVCKSWTCYFLKKQIIFKPNVYSLLFNKIIDSCVGFKKGDLTCMSAGSLVSLSAEFDR